MKLVIFSVVDIINNINNINNIKMENKIVTEDVLENLVACPFGGSWYVLIWKDGTVSSILGSGYAGEQDGNDPILILERNRFEDLSGWEGDADLWNEIEEQIEEAGGSYTRRDWKE